MAARKGVWRHRAAFSPSVLLQNVRQCEKVVTDTPERARSRSGPNKMLRVISTPSVEFVRRRDLKYRRRFLALKVSDRYPKWFREDEPWIGYFHIASSEFRDPVRFRGDVDNMGCKGRSKSALTAALPFVEHLL